MPGPSPTSVGFELAHATRKQLPMTRRRVIERAAFLLENIPQTSCLCPSFTRSKPCPLLKMLQILEQRLVARQFVDVVDAGVADDSLFVYEESRPFREALRTKDTILLSHLPVGPEITQQQNTFHPQRAGPGVVGGCAVHADTQNLGIYRLEARHVGFKGGDLL